MSIELLDKTRKVNQLLHNNSGEKLIFNDVCEVLTQVLDSSVYVLSRKGKLLGIGKSETSVELQPLVTDIVGEFISPVINDRILNVLSTKENVNLATLGLPEDAVKGQFGIILPVYISGERLGTLFMYRGKGQYDIEDIILSEYGATVISLLLLSSVNEENVEELRKVQVVQNAVDSLSKSELEAVYCILFEEIKEEEGMLVASKVADRLGITRSIIVNALRKLESAGVIEARSQGMKGTYLKVLNDSVYDELEKVKKSQ